MDIATPPRAVQTLAGVVVVHTGHPPQPAEGHEAVTRAAIAREIAALKSFAYAGEFDHAFDYPGAVYHVPRDTLLTAEAIALGIRSRDDLFGGVAPYAFVPTKSIGHPLVSPDAAAPAGWSHAFAAAVAGDVLAGHTAFSVADAVAAAVRLLADGPVRVKRSLGIGGGGQTVANDRDTVEAAVEAIDPQELRSCGVVVEQNLEDVVTYSVGQVHVAGLTASYYGTQRLTRNHAGNEVYGGSDLVVANGGFDALLALEVPEDARIAIGKAHGYHAAAVAHYPGILASRINYDVAYGTDGDGRPRGGVLEQSWRLGGASGAEVAALAAFRRDAGLRAVRASAVEHHGDCEPPEGAVVHYRDVDPRLGTLTKYVVVQAA
jgi:hypothetical protein